MIVDSTNISSALRLAPARRYRQIIAPRTDIDTLHDAVQSLKETVETMTRQRGDIRDSMVTVADLQNHINAINPHENYTLESSALKFFVSKGYGGIFLGTPTAGSDIGAGYVTVPFDTERLAEPHNVLQDVANDSLAIQEAGIWLMNVFITFTHNESNQGRLCSFRIYNSTNDEPSRATVFATGRNTPATTVSFGLLVEMTNEDLNDLFRIELGDADGSYTSVEYQTCSYSFTHVSEYRGEL